MLKEMVAKWFKPVENFEDGSSVYFIQKESLRYQQQENQYIDFDIEFDGRRFIKVENTLLWKGAMILSVNTDKVSEIKRKISIFFEKRGIEIQIK